MADNVARGLAMQALGTIPKTTSADAGKLATVDSNGKWVAANLTVGQGEVAVDSTLLVSGAAADAKATGDKITDLKTAIEQSETMTVQNRIIDPSFVNINDTSKIAFTYFTTKTVDDGIVTATKTSTGQARATIKSTAITSKDICYVSIWVKFTPSSGTMQTDVPYVSTKGGKYVLTQNDYDKWVKVNLIGAAKDNAINIDVGFGNSNTSPQYTISFKKPFVADMTELFGVGNELSLEDATAYFADTDNRDDIKTINVSKSVSDTMSQTLYGLIAENIFPATGNYYSSINFNANKDNYTWNTYEWSDTAKDEAGDGTNNYIKVSSNVYGYSNSYAQLVGSEADDLIYFGLMLKTNVACEYVNVAASAHPEYGTNGTIYHPDTNVWTHVSHVARIGTTTYLGAAALYADNSTQGTAVLNYKCGLCINLTKTFGKGNEPTREQMDILLSAYPNFWFTAKRPLFSSNLMKSVYMSRNIDPCTRSSYGYDDEGAFVCESHVDKDWSGWSNGRYSYGQNAQQNKVYSTFDHSLVSDGMFVSDGKSGAWSTQGSGQNTYGGHVFQGWNEIGTYRLSLMIGNSKVGGVPREDEAAILVYSPNCFNNPSQALTEWQQQNRITPQSRDYYGGNSSLLLGRLRLGSDLHEEGLLIERKRFTHFGDIVQTNDGVTYRKIQFNNDGTITWVDCTSEMNDPS